MNKLNTQQIVLLCILVAFVTSIATGITVVSLMQQSPEPVTQTINRVVERTVERVVESDDEPEVVAAPVVEPEVVTVVVNNEELTIEAVEKISQSVVRIYTDEGSIRGSTRTFRGLGLVVDAKGTIITDATAIDPTVNSRFDYIATIGGAEFEVEIVEETSNSLAVLMPADGQTLPTFVPAKFGDASTLKLTQTVVAISGEQNNVALNGTVTELIPGESGAVRQINTSVSGTQTLPGSILMNVNGTVVGIHAELFAAAGGAFMPSNLISLVNSAE